MGGTFRFSFPGFRGGVRGTTFLEADVLATYPRDEVRGVSLRRSVKLSETPVLGFDVGVDDGRVWRLEIWAINPAENGSRSALISASSLANKSTSVSISSSCSATNVLREPHTGEI